MTTTDIRAVMTALRSDIARREQAIAKHQTAIAELEAANDEDTAAIRIAEELEARAAADPTIFAKHGGTDLAVAALIDDIYRASSDSQLSAGTGAGR